MSKLIEDMLTEYGKEMAIVSAVDTARRYCVSESVILADIMKRFNLSESEAESYMLKKSA